VGLLVRLPVPVGTVDRAYADRYQAFFFWRKKVRKKGSGKKGSEGKRGQEPFFSNSSMIKYIHAKNK